MKQTIVINSQTFLVSERAFDKISKLIEDDLQQQEINRSIWKSMNKSEQETYSNNLSSSWKLPQEKALLFSKDS